MRESVRPAVSVYGRSYVLIPSQLPRQVAAWLLVRHLTSIGSQVVLSETLGVYPLSVTGAEQIRENGDLSRTWVNGLDLLETAQYEPRWPSWRVVRGAVQDAAAEVLKPGFSSGTVSVVLDQFQELVDDLHNGE